jgi:PIN domain nuclease of toxin-antitoxin system
VSAPNFAEALSKLIDARPALADTLPDAAPRRTSETGATLLDLPMAGGAIVIEPFTLEDAVLCAKLRPMTKSAGLSLGDRCCLALARRLGAPALTSDAAWVKLDVGVAVRLIRGVGVQ